MKKKAEKKNWIVRVKCEVWKDVYCEDCTEEEATREPFDHAVNEIEIDQWDWEVQRVEVNCE